MILNPGERGEIEIPLPPDELRDQMVAAGAVLSARQLQAIKSGPHTWLMEVQLYVDGVPYSSFAWEVDNLPALQPRPYTWKRFLRFYAVALLGSVPASFGVGWLLRGNHLAVWLSVPAGVAAGWLAIWLYERPRK